MPSIAASRRDQPRQRPGAAVGAPAVIGVDVLAEQRDLAHAMIGKAAGLGLHVGDGPRELGAARVGHDAEGAELVAALLHGEERRHAPWRGARSGSRRTCPPRESPVSTMPTRRSRSGPGERSPSRDSSAGPRPDRRPARGARSRRPRPGRRSRPPRRSCPCQRWRVAPSPGGCGRDRNRPSRPPSRGCGRC